MSLKKNAFRSTLTFSSALLLAACASDRPEPAPVTYRTPASPSPTSRPAAQPDVAPAAAPSPVPSGQADGRGVVYYDGYETIRARSGDSVDAMAGRVGLTAAELAAYNGLSTQYEPREGDELVLPERPGRYQNAVASAPAAAPLGAPGGYTPSAPERQGVEVAAAGPASAAPSGDGWSADLARDAIGEAPASGVSSEPLSPPPAADAPEPAAPETQTASVEPPSPASEAAPAAAPAAGASGFARPVDAAVSRPFSRTPGPNRNDGVDFATAAGDPVRAAGDGSVALISQSLGGLGTIILIRHDNEYLTVYGRVDGVAVAKGDRVAKGQIIARVADLAPPQGPSLHFEVRRGAESIDPAPYL